MALSWTEIGKNARTFVKAWKNTSGEEKQLDQKFLNDFFAVFGVASENLLYQYPVKMEDGSTKWADCFWKGMILVEMKSKGRGETVLQDAYAQALQYYYRIEEEDRPKLILVCDFENFCLYNMESKAGDAERFKLGSFASRIRLFDSFLGVETAWRPSDNADLHVEVAYKMAKLHDKMAALGYEGHELRVYLVRLMFCLFAEDTGIFGKDSFYDYLQNCKEDGSDLGSRLADLFEVLDMSPAVRAKRPYLSDELKAFQYINGSLFREVLHKSYFDSEMRRLLIDCCGSNWEQIKPEIFGAMFQGVMDAKERRELGAHYTSEENILKVINPLFMDSLREEFERSKRSTKTLEAFQQKLSRLKFLDPACGCGNFLIVAYRELRLLELEVVKVLRDDFRQQVLDAADLCLVNVNQFYGIEYEEFPSEIARVGMWLCDHLMNRAAADMFGYYPPRLPLREAAHIVCGNALRIDWEEVVPKGELSYILGNPPFLGYSMQSKEQKEDMLFVYVDETGKPFKTAGKIDYVAAWYYKACQYMQGTQIKAAFVSTNSITQGDQVAFVWKPLYEMFDVSINFGYRTFKWSNEARGKAAVHCVIIGFDVTQTPNALRFIFDEDGDKMFAKNINPYLLDVPTVFIESRKNPISAVPEIISGNRPADDGNLIIEAKEYEDFISQEPNAVKYIRRLMGAEEYINNKNRWCLWLVDVNPSELKKMPYVMERVNKVKDFRLKSTKVATQKYADYPTLFQEIRQPTTNYLLIPRHSSEKREYIPIGFVTPDIITTDATIILPDATLYHFGVLTSNIHMAWVRAVCGRLEMRYRYSKDIVYNNFPFPNPTEAQKADIEKYAQGVLDARGLYPDSSLADLYDPLTMPPELRKAHDKLDRAVEKAYGRRFEGEAEIVAFLMEKYKEMTKE